MMRHAEHAGTDALGDPHARDEVADTRADLHEIAGFEADTPRVRRRDPQRILVRDLVEPFHRRSRMNQGRQSEVRQQIELVWAVRITREVAPVHVSGHVAWDRVLRPAPVDEGLRSELESSRWSREACNCLAVDDDADWRA